MRSIAVMNQKGGVGKTTTSVNVAAALARSGKRVLLIDMDPQAHASLHFGVEPQVDSPSIYDVLTDDVPLADVRREALENLWLVPSHLDLAAAEVELAGVVGREFILRDKLAADKMTFDHLVIDCPPSLGVLTLNALVAANEIIIPLQPHFLALHGLSKLLQTIDLVSRRLNNRLRLTGIVLCLYDSATTLAKEVAGDVETFFENERNRDGKTPWADATVYRTRIRRNIRLAEAPSFGKPIFDYDPRSNGAEDYLALTREIAASESRFDKTTRSESAPDAEKASRSESAPESHSDGENETRFESLSETENGSRLTPDHASSDAAPDDAKKDFFSPNPLPMETD